MKAVQKSDRYQWVLQHMGTGEVLFRRVSGLAQVDQESYHRELRWDAPKKWEEGAELVMEFSVPKFWYGHNIHLLYALLPALSDLRLKLMDQFEMRRLPLPDPRSWSVYRLDVCYAWRFPTQKLAQSYLDGLKHLSYPRRKPIVYPTSIVFPGATASFKIYLKYPEFRHHDKKALTKSKASPEWISYLEALATGVLRCEATLRTRYLRRRDIKTVSDLLDPVRQAIWDEELAVHEDFKPEVSFTAAIGYYAMMHNLPMEQNTESGNETPLIDGMRFYAPPTQIELEGTVHYHPGGGFNLKVTDKLTFLIQYCLTRFVGNNTKMQEPEEVQIKLLEFYSSVKAGRLVSFWLYVQRFGEAQAKTVYGKNSFYRAKNDLKKAGIALVGEPKKVTEIDKKFLKQFELVVPSQFATNKYDDHRDSANILNFVPLVSGQF